MSAQTFPKWTVGQIAARCGVKVSTLHFYEDKALIYSLRNAGNQRRYYPDTIRRVSIIKAAQKMGVSLEKIKESLDLLPNKRTPTKGDWEKMSTQWHSMLDERIEALSRLRNTITGCIGCGCLSMEKCPIYNPDDILGNNAKGPILLDRPSKST
ncbi:redox-sensitive transcriptional activator SoxR [Temperatibacter marinus]|uniref:Redox-sensitive transcriptional activator SoxR n=1 Tax=Temperatibacter marinus TaxID=1456591 RepID=A0AA52EJ23_9PROT|nr:redox-sensitive transcriptional activator SoxR [Temperatibacter marinus]WND03715.1 redox-sensitive transcriptional activator SoxR [Temperatibacter marinus]